ncbi:MAG TPA: hypothetical protein VN827_10715 [Chthoniobacterales bacterium]|nr:hypothetical protein [Chthoniobacterales bacterium]
MSRENGAEALFQRELARVEILAGLRHALDFRYRRLCEAARADWQRLFGGKDPADSCVSVRVAAIPASAIRGSGFLKSRKPSGPKPSTKRLPGFAH